MFRGAGCFCCPLRVQEEFRLLVGCSKPSAGMACTRRGVALRIPSTRSVATQVPSHPSIYLLPADMICRRPKFRIPTRKPDDCFSQVKWSLVVNFLHH